MRIPFVVARSSKKTREWFRGTMLYVRHNPSWFLRIFEIDSRKQAKHSLDFGGVCPDGVVACGVPHRYVVKELQSQGYHNVPISAVPHDGVERNCVAVSLDVKAIAKTACSLFAKRGCHHVAYVGANFPSEIRMSRLLRKAMISQSAADGLEFMSVLRKTSASYGAQIKDQPDLSAWLAALPKPCGILAWNDNIGRDILDLCRAGNFKVPGAFYVLGIDDNALICENSFPTLSSIKVDYEQSAYEAAKQLDELIKGRNMRSRCVVCGVKGVTERASTQDVKGSARLVAMACEYIAKEACHQRTLDQHQIAAHLGVSVRTLQLRFKDSGYKRTILQEIQYVRLNRVCWLLIHSDKTISDITFEAGFRSQSRLKALFQQQYGMSMREYRRGKFSPPPPDSLNYRDKDIDWR